MNSKNKTPKVKPDDPVIDSPSFDKQSCIARRKIVKGFGCLESGDRCIPTEQCEEVVSGHLEWLKRAGLKLNRNKYRETHGESAKSVLANCLVINS